MFPSKRWGESLECSQKINLNQVCFHQVVGAENYTHSRTSRILLITCSLLGIYWNLVVFHLKHLEYFFLRWEQGKLLSLHRSTRIYYSRWPSVPWKYLKDTVYILIIWNSSRLYTTDTLGSVAYNHVFWLQFNAFFTIYQLSFWRLNRQFDWNYLAGVHNPGLMDTLQPIRIEYAKKYKLRIDLLFDDAVLSQPQVEPTSQRASCRVNALLQANQNQACLNEVE